MADDPSRDKDFSFARLSDLKDVAVALKMYVVCSGYYCYLQTMVWVWVGVPVSPMCANRYRGSLEGKIPRKPISTALDLPELRYTALQDE